MNKRGNLPIIILVLGVLAVCSLALLSFYSSNFKVSNNFAGVKIIEGLHAQAEIDSYQEKPATELYDDKKVLRPKLFKPLNKEIIFSVTYNPQ